MHFLVYLEVKEVHNEVILTFVGLNPESFPIFPQNQTLDISTTPPNDKQAELIYLFTLQTAQTIHNRVSAEHSGPSPTFISVLMRFTAKSLPLLSFYLTTKGMPIPNTVYDPSLTNNLLSNRKNNFYNLENHFFIHLGQQLPSTLGNHFSSFIICNFTSFSGSR